MSTAKEKYENSFSRLTPFYKKYFKVRKNASIYEYNQAFDNIMTWNEQRRITQRNRKRTLVKKDSFSDDISQSLECVRNVRLHWFVKNSQFIPK